MSDDQKSSGDTGAAHSGRGAYDDASTPRDLKIKLKEQRLVIDWKDGERSEFTLAQLRRACPCATCRGEREHADENPLKILKADPTGVRVTSARLMGNYAIQFDWSDGHNTGIFDFRMLRAMGTC
ncbi:MAG: DUF971 domain-containing protein [Planctomycetes bacterium]|nr:DUF971 domain-containing protein [Planctomycetota bacterium]MCH7632272.1 DUF971 domain-containing protein [Planctomycetota bacterium]